MAEAAKSTVPSTLKGPGLVCVPLKVSEPGSWKSV